METVGSDIAAEQIAFLRLVCGYDTICILNDDEIEELLDLESEESQWVRVEYPKRSSMRDRGSEGEVKYTIKTLSN